MHTHILGICGTFMGGAAVLARALGHSVSGSDARVYPPMSTQLAGLGITLRDGYDPAHLDPAPDLVLIGNALSRGNPEVEAVLDRGIPYTSGAQWLAESVLAGRIVLACAGTHGKTTTASMLAWILEHAGLNPGFLIGGAPENFSVTARLGGGSCFVIEADEYDTAFFDKRSKFVHYHPHIAVLGNLEYDHADIFPDIDAIKRQFHHLVRTVPGTGLLVVNAEDKNLADVLAMGCWTPVQPFNAADGWRAEELTPDCSRFRVLYQGRDVGEIAWNLAGRHNMSNALAAIVAAQRMEVTIATAAAALARFRGVKRRLERRGTVGGVTVYDDFAHHPTEIAATLQALRARVGESRIIAVLEPRSNTMRMGAHRGTLAASLDRANRAILYQPPDLPWDLKGLCAELPGKAEVYESVEAILAALEPGLRENDHILIMSNGGFENIHERLLERLHRTRAPARLGAGEAG